MKEYVLVYCDATYFKEQNTYLGIALITDKLEEAKKMSLDSAEGNLKCMSEPNSWSIWSVKKGLVLDQKSERHIVEAKRAELQRQLDALPKV